MLETTTMANLFCIGGEAPLLFDSLPEVNILVQGFPAGDILNMMPDINLIPLSICALLTAEAGGFPIPCMPMPVGTWLPGAPNVVLNGKPALDNMSVLPCAVGGVITIVFPNNETVWLAL